VVLQIILVFAMIGVLGLLLRWAFARDKQAPQWPASAASTASPPDSAASPPASAETQPASAEAQPASAEAQPGAAPAAAAPFVADAPTAADVEREDYGLLAEVAIAASGEEAERIKARLGAVGIRATTTVGRDGRHRVLVFASEIHRARRVAGGS